MTSACMAVIGMKTADCVFLISADSKFWTVIFLLAGTLCNNYERQVRLLTEPAETPVKSLILNLYISL